MANNIIKVIIAGVQLVGRAFTRAVQKEYNASMQAAAKAGGGKKGAESAASSSLFGMSLDEAKQIINVTNIHNRDELIKNYEHLMKVNDKATGGSFYLQSKIYRAKERIDAEIEGKNIHEKNENMEDKSTT